MEAAQTTFISSTFWTERIGPTAALKALEVIERVQSWKTITRTGQGIGERWASLARDYGLPMTVSGLPSMIGFAIDSPDWLKYKTLITQEMLKAGFLATNACYPSIRHGEAEIDAYFAALQPVLALVRECMDGRPVDPLLDGPPCHGGFRRLS